METLLKIKSAGLTKFNNSEYTNFLRRIEKLILEIGVEILGLPPTFLNKFSQNLRLMDDIVAQSKIDADTKNLSKLDIQRDSVWVYIFTLIEVASRLEVECPEREAGIALLEQVKSYRKLHTLPNMQETQEIRSLMIDLQKSKNTPHLVALHLSSFVEGLNLLNETYSNITDTRTDVRIDEKLPDSKQIRNNLDAQYQYLTDIVFAKNATDSNEQLPKFITKTNQIIEESNTAYNQRKASKKKSEE